MKKLLTCVLIFILLGTYSHATTATEENVAKLYIATFDRAPDIPGLEYWVNVGISLEDIAQSFFDQPETKKTYPEGSTVGDFIEAVYNNLFDREPDPEGFAYWEKQINSGTVERSVFLLAIINGARGNDAVILKDKTDYALENMQDESHTVIDIYILYSPESVEGLGDPTTAIEHVVNYANIINEQSHISLIYNIVEMEEDTSHTYIHESSKDEGYFEDLERITPSISSSILSKRDSNKADVIVGFRTPSDKACGLAWLGEIDEETSKIWTSGYAAALISITENCSSETFAHELGHILGLRHSEAQGEEGGVFSYARGYGVDGEFATVMAYPSAYNVYRSASLYSSPDLLCGDNQDLLCGVPGGQPHEADAARAIRELKDDVAAYR